MALTAQQRAEVRRVLGWSAQYSQTDSALEGAFDGLATEPEHETQVIELLADIALVRAQLIDSRKRLKATKVGSIELDTMRKEMAALRWEGMRLTGELASIMGVERRNNVFGSGGSLNQNYIG